jgi:hypothetical protein
VEDRVRSGLATLAGPQAGRDQAWRALQRARADAERRRGRRTVWLAAAAVLVVVLAAGGAVRWLAIPGPDTASPAAHQWISEWPARGDLTGDGALIDRATALWRSDAPAALRPAGRVTTLYAGREANHGTTVVMLLAQDADRALVGMVTSMENLSGPPEPSNDLVLRAVAPIDAHTVIRSVGFVTSALPADRPGDMAGSLGFVLLAPGVDAGEVRSSMIDSVMTDNDQLSPAVDGLVRYEGFPGSGAWNSWVLTPAGTAGRDVLAGGITDPSYQPGTADLDGRVRADNGAALHAGDLVVARDDRPAGNGLLGVVTSTSDNGGQIDPTLANLARWNLRVVSVSSDYRGALSRDSAGRLVFTTDDPAAPNGVSRVAVQTDDGKVTVNVGAFSDPDHPGRSNTKSPFPLKQSDTLSATGPTPVWIIATGSA